MTNPAAPLLSESEVSEIEARHGKADSIVEDFYANEYAVAAVLNDIPALIRDWRALKARLTACEGSRRVHELDNHHNALACGYCAGPLKNELTRLLSIEPEAITLREQNAALREQLAQETQRRIDAEKAAEK